jgi:hypothetical protein
MHPWHGGSREVGKSGCWKFEIRGGGGKAVPNCSAGLESMCITDVILMSPAISQAKTYIEYLIQVASAVVPRLQVARASYLLGLANGLSAAQV